MQKQAKRMRPELLMFFVLIALAALGNGLSDSIYANYFKDAYNVDAVQRGFLEFPRELPGLLCALIIAALSSLGDLRTAFIAQLLSTFGLMALGLLTPPFGVMTVFLFITSMGMHMFMPLQDSIGMDLAEPDNVGKRVGQYASVKSAVGFAAALLVFFGFRLGWFSFTTDIKWIFMIGVAAFACAAVLAFAMIRRMNPPRAKRSKVKLILRREYRYYYTLTILHGVQKQVTYVYASWVLIEILSKGADTMALLAIAASFSGIFFMNWLGRLIDKLGIKKMMYVDAWSFILVYIAYGVVAWALTAQLIPSAGWSVGLVYVLFVLDRLSMQMGVVKSVYLRSIARSDSEITATLSTGTSLDHVVSIVAAMLGGMVWSVWGSHWVFFIGAAFSLGNLYVAWRVQPEKEREQAQRARAQA